MEQGLIKACAELARMGVKNPVCSLIRSKAGISLWRVESESRRFILKNFGSIEDRREIDNYLMLSQLGIKTLPLLGYTECSVLLPDVDASSGYRMGTSADLSSPQTAGAVAKWYKELHTKGRDYLAQNKTSLYDESDVITIAGIESIAAKTGTEDNALWKTIIDNYGLIRCKIDALPRTLTYNDFYYTNLVVEKSYGCAFMLDYNFLGQGTAYSDIRNVTASLSDEAAAAFLCVYGGIGDMKSQALADAFIAPVVTLFHACGRAQFPSWADASLEALKSGDIMRHFNDWINMDI